MPRGYTVALLTPEDRRIYNKMSFTTRVMYMVAESKDMRVMEDAEMRSQFTTPRQRVLDRLHGFPTA